MPASSVSTSPQRSALLRLSLALIACLGAILACGPEPPDTDAHPLSAYDLQVLLSPTGEATTRQVEVLMYYQSEVQHLPDKTESIACDGVTLTLDPDYGYFLGNVPLKAPGTSYHCALTSHGEAASLVIPAIAPPMPTASTPGAALSRQAGFDVTYAPGSSIGEISVQAHFSDRNPLPIDCLARQTGPATFIVDSREELRKAPPGPGFLDIFTDMKTPIASTGGVHSLVVTSSWLTTIAVSWT